LFFSAPLSFPPPLPGCDAGFRVFRVVHLGRFGSPPPPLNLLTSTACLADNTARFQGMTLFGFPLAPEQPPLGSKRSHSSEFMEAFPPSLICLFTASPCPHTKSCGLCFLSPVFGHFSRACFPSFSAVMCPFFFLSSSEWTCVLPLLEHGPSFFRLIVPGSEPVLLFNTSHSSPVARWFDIFRAFLRTMFLFSPPYHGHSLS